MALKVSEMLGIIGIQTTAPTTLAEALPWLLTVFISIGIFTMILGFLGGMFKIMLKVRI